MDSFQQQQFAINLMGHLVTATFVLDDTGKVIIWNKACERLTGITAKEVIGTDHHWQAFYSEKRPCLADLLVQNRIDEIDELYVYHAEPASYGNGYQAENWCFLPRLNRRLYIAFDSGPIFDSHGKLIAIVETMRDMTEYKTVQSALEKLVEIDDLTGLSNRRYLAEHLETEWAAAMVNNSHFSLVIADIDFFKQYNDTYSHQVGDECLKMIASVMQNSLLRNADVAIRFGGEEFCVSLLNTQANVACDIAERMRQNIYAKALQHETSDIADYVTISCGVASMIPTGDKQAAELIKLADEAFYAEKAAGRIRTIEYRDNLAPEKMRS